MTEQAAGTTADIFISYARDDAVFAARLREGIESSGFSVWMDTTSMAGGERWTKEIESAIEGATSVVVVVSASSNESVWVRREVLYAQQLGKRVVPVLAAQVALPVHLVNLNAVALQEDFNAGLDRLLNALLGQPAGAVVAAGKRTPPVHIGKALWLFVGAAVVVVLAVIAVRGEGPIAEVFATGIAIGGALLAMAWKADDAISLEFKRDLSLWLDGIDPAAVGHSMQRWPTYFAALFDRVFGKKHLSWRCFFRSSIASLLAFLLCTLIFMQAAPGEWAAFLSSVVWSPFSDGVAPFVFLVSVAAIANLLPDYVSLLETRWVIHRIQQTSSLAGQVGWLLVDFVATGAIFFLFLGVFFFCAVLFGGGWRDTGEVLISYFSEFVPALLQMSLLAPVQDQQERYVAITVWTTYFTTVWVWLYFLAQFLMRLATPLRRTLGFMKYALPVEQRPLRAVGQVMALVACAVYCLVMLSTSTLNGSELTSPLKPEMVKIEPGEFPMGGTGWQHERPVHQVTIAKPFAIGKYEVTFQEYDRFAKSTGLALPDAKSWGWGKRPVINVSWNDATAYAKWLSEQTGQRYRLPTEAEWEYAARAETKTKYWWGDEIGKNRANCDGCGSEWDGKDETAPVGSFEPNPRGLHDTAGNVEEWVQDCWHGDYNGSPPTDGSAWKKEDDGDCARHVSRGGSWLNYPRSLRSASRHVRKTDTRDYDLGFRLAQDLGP